ncbi:hypothetical protein LX66_3621 [Chitinophaga japonensis]|uniref:Uncharacterized protein n=1 Tax=Chitinophaga japonensis TaxID=104662 RepID=A0A562SZD3_CHIJA|nr:hypothetical protein LX66_3621 [Chitinophaga japonensis]
MVAGPERSIIPLPFYAFPARSASPLKAVPAKASTSVTMAPAFPLPEPKTAPADTLRCTTLSKMAMPPSNKAMMACPCFLPPCSAPAIGAEFARALARHPIPRLMIAIIPPTMDHARPVVMPVTAGDVPSGAACENTRPAAKRRDPIIKQAAKINGRYFLTKVLPCKLIKLFLTKLHAAHRAKLENRDMLPPPDQGLNSSKAR